MNFRIMLTGIGITLMGSVCATEPVFGPHIEIGGPVFLVDDRDVPLQTGHKYRVVFDVKDYPEGMDNLNIELENVARFINMHGQHGVPLEDMDIAVVVHGKALFAAMNNETYIEMHGIDNPSLTLMNELAGAGVKLFACGQSLGFRGLDKSVLADTVKVSLSAMTTLVPLQAEGYAFLP